MKFEMIDDAFCKFKNEQLFVLKGAKVKSVTLDADNNRFEIEFFGDITVSCPADVFEINIPSDFFDVEIIDPIPVRR